MSSISRLQQYPLQLQGIDQQRWGISATVKNIFDRSTYLEPESPQVRDLMAQIASYSELDKALDLNKHQILFDRHELEQDYGYFSQVQQFASGSPYAQPLLGQLQQNIEQRAQLRQQAFAIIAQKLHLNVEGPAAMALSAQVQQLDPIYSQLEQQRTQLQVQLSQLAPGAVPFMPTQGHISQFNAMSDALQLDHDLELKGLFINQAMASLTNVQAALTTIGGNLIQQSAPAITLHARQAAIGQLQQTLMMNRSIAMQQREHAQQQYQFGLQQVLA